MNYLDDISDQILQVLENGIDDITEKTKKIADECSEECLEAIKNDSPSDSGDYKEGWTRKKTKTGYIIYNKSKSNIQMPLEHGRISLKSGQRVGKRPHIYENANKYKEKFFDRCQKEI